MGQGLVRRRDSLAGPLALGTGWSLRIGVTSQGIGVDVLLEEPNGQIAAEFAGALFALIEGDQLILIASIEQEVESGGGVRKKALAEFLAGGVGRRLRIVHDGYSKGPIIDRQLLGYLIPTSRAQERDCTHGAVVTCSGGVWERRIVGIVSWALESKSRVAL